MLAVVVADGDPAPEDAELVRRADLLVAADGGARWIQSLGVVPHLVVGDLDSLDEATIAALSGAGARVERYPSDKDASDTELAVEAALRAGAEQVVVLGALRPEQVRTLFRELAQRRLAHTGNTSGTLVLIGSLALLGGAALVGLARRPRRRTA